MAIVGGKKDGKKEDDSNKKPLLPLSMQAQRDTTNWYRQDAAEAEELAKEREAEKAELDEEAGK